MTVNDTVESVKRDAKAITRATTISHSQALDVLAVQAGYTHWGAYQASILEAEGRQSRTVLPIELIRAMLPALGIYIPPAVEKARHLIVSGGTGTGKTTTLRRLLGFVPDISVVAVLDEHAEIPQSASIDLEVNSGGLRDIGHEAYRISHLAALRNDANVVVFGEVSTRNARIVLDAIREPQGPAILTTIHAESPHDARTAFAQRAPGQKPLSREDAVVCLQMRRDVTGQRHISEIVTF